MESFSRDTFHLSQEGDPTWHKNIQRPRDHFHFEVERCMLRRALADSHARGKSIRTLVGNIRAGPQRRRAGAPQDAGTFCGDPGFSTPPD